MNHIMHKYLKEDTQSMGTDSFQCGPNDRTGNGHKPNEVPSLLHG